MRRNIVAGNWKMNKNFQDADDLIYEISEQLKEKGSGDADIIVCPPAVYLELCSDVATETEIMIGAQNMCQWEEGAYTGEISAMMLESMGVTHVILGHSERRTYFGETDKIIAEKINMALKHSLEPIYCCGEVLAERESNKHLDVISKQISEALFHLTADEIQNVIIAYEPVWAIGTGKTATPAQAQEMHAFIRNLLKEKYGEAVSNNISILYGGSCNAKNAKELFANADVDGGLIGGASLKADDFLTIINAF